jgi:Holliday junction DNA helicase RuvA
MISGIAGVLESVDDDRVFVRVGAMVFEVLVPAADVEGLRARRGEEFTFHTIFYLAGDPTRGSLEPTLIGFVNPEDRRFFELFTTVKGIGPKTALKALTVPTGEIARAIEEKDTRFLVGLSGIGKRTAELIVAELSGKVGRFALPGGRAKAPVAVKRSDAEEDAIAALVQLGERRGDAQALLDRVKQANADLKTTEALVREMLRMRG